MTPYGWALPVRTLALPPLAAALAVLLLACTEGAPHHLDASGRSEDAPPTPTAILVAASRAPDRPEVLGRRRTETAVPVPRSSTYDLPAPTDGWGWVSSDGHRATYHLDELLHRLGYVVGERGTVSYAADRLTVTSADEAVHAEVRAVLGSRALPAVWLGRSSAREDWRRMRAGTERERAWAETLATRFPYLGEEDAQDPQNDPVEETPEPGPAQPPVRVTLRWFRASTSLVADVVAGGLRGPASAAERMWSAGNSVSTDALLDEVQEALVLRCCEKEGDAADGTILEKTVKDRLPETVDLDGSAVLWLRVAVQGTNLVVDLGVRYEQQGDMRFFSRSIHVVPEGSALLVRPAERFDPKSTGVADRYLLVHVDLAPTEQGEAPATASELPKQGE